MNRFTPELYELVDEKGHRKNFELLDTAVLDGVRYYVMIPAVEGEELLLNDGDYIILKSEYINDEEILASITDEDELENASLFFSERFEELEDEDYDGEEYDYEFDDDEYGLY